MSTLLLMSILLRIAGTGYSVLFLYRSGDRRFVFLTVMLGLMASRQIWTLQTVGGTGLSELPGLVVSVFAVATVYYFAQYVEEETRIKNDLSAANERLRGFRKAVEQAGHAILLADRDGTIEYANPATETVTGYSPSEVVDRTPAVWSSDQHDDAFYDDLWGTITGGDVWDGEIVNRRKDGDLCWVDATIAPITDVDGDVKRFVAVETDVTDRKEREIRIRNQHAQLELLNTTNEVIRDVNRELLRTESKADVETVACEQFANAEPYESAWFAARNAATDTVRANTGVGIEDARLADVVAAVNDADRETIVEQALETAGTRVAREDDSDDTASGNSADETSGTSCPCHASVDAAATVAIPLCYRDAHYGALVVHAVDDTTTDALDIDVLDELGETIAYAMTAAESQRSLMTDRVTALTFDLTPDDDPLIALADGLDCELELEHVTTDSSDELVEFVTIRGANAEDVAAYAANTTDITAVQPIRGGPESLVRLTVVESAIVGTLAKYGSAAETLIADGADGTLVAEVSETADVRTVVEAIAETHPGADLVSQRERDRTPETRGQFRSTVEERVTGRQFEALQLAHFGGYFDWPRESSGNELADRMGVCQSTYLQHLRGGQRKLFEEFFDSDRAADTNPSDIAAKTVEMG